MRALHNKAKNQMFASVTRDYPLTLADVEDWVLNRVLKPALSTANHSAIVFLGQSAIGKTLLAHCLALAISDFYIQREGLDQRPQFKTTTNLDMLRGERGEPATCVFDDG
eukprot:4548341-Amphidinium_carterae.1